VLTVSTIAQHGFLGGTMVAPVDISYLADTVILFRYFELEGEVRKALSVMKKRSGLHQSAIRQYTMSAAGVEIGPPLRGFRGIMTGVPVYSGEHRSPASGR
jgi:circadian clock protein KaiC